MLMGLWNGQAVWGDAPRVQHIDKCGHGIDVRDGAAANDGLPARQDQAVILELSTLQYRQELRDHEC